MLLAVKHLLHSTHFLPFEVNKKDLCEKKLTRVKIYRNSVYCIIVEENRVLTCDNRRREKHKPELFATFKAKC